LFVVELNHHCPAVVRSDPVCAFVKEGKVNTEPVMLRDPVIAVVWSCAICSTCIYYK
jgi:hypothetical protein